VHDVDLGKSALPYAEAPGGFIFALMCFSTAAPEEVSSGTAKRELLTINAYVIPKP
jgi:hypothetical protein